MVPVDYKYKTTPYDHQREVFELTRDREYYGLFWEQGTGKTKPIIDTAAWLYEKGAIDTLLVIAPNGVHRNWTVKEIQAHLPDRVMRHTTAFTYHSSKARTKRAKKEAADSLAAKGLLIVAMSYDSITTEAGKDYAKQVLKTRKCLYVLDESTRIQNVKSKRAKVILASGLHAPYRRILTGTPVASGPFAIYSQFRFLSPSYWKTKRLGSYTMFKNYFARWREGRQADSGRVFPILVNYQYLDELQNIIKNDSSRVLKKDVLDLPPKVYGKLFFEMSPKQKKLYEALKKNYIAEMENGSIVTGAMALTRMLRLQQITCGYVAVDEPSGAYVDDVEEFTTKLVEIESAKKNPRLRLLLDAVEDLPHKAIIWARFSKDIDMICAALGDTAVRFDGACGVDERAHALESFQDGLHGDAKFLVANAQAAGTGLTLTAAKTVIYYNNSFKLEERLQSEDRAHRIGQDQKVQYLDIVAEDTMDEYIIDALKDKLDLSDQITGDKLREWL